VSARVSFNTQTYTTVLYNVPAYVGCLCDGCSLVDWEARSSMDRRYRIHSCPYNLT